LKRIIAPVKPVVAHVPHHVTQIEMVASSANQGVPRSRADHFPTLLGGEAQPGMTGTDAVLAAAFATMLANQAGGLFVRQIAGGSPIGELPLVVGGFELRQLISTRLGVFSSSENTVVWGIMGVTGG